MYQPMLPDDLIIVPTLEPISFPRSSVGTQTGMLQRPVLYHPPVMKHYQAIGRDALIPVWRCKYRVPERAAKPELCACVDGTLEHQGMHSHAGAWERGQKNTSEEMPHF